MKKIELFVRVLLLLGALNWGLVGAFNFNLVHFLFEKVYIDRLIYAVIGVAAIYHIVYWSAMNAPVRK